MNRIEGLVSRHPGLAQLRGAVLADDLDPELQAMTEQASRELAMPMAAVSLVLEHVQFFRGYHGLPPELEASRATDRDLSFCQFVVRDESLFEVTDAVTDTRVPQELVERYGARAYIGAPIRIGGEVVGAMCAIDVKPRTFDSSDRARLTRIAGAASKRLAVLAMQPRDRERTLHDQAVRPVFGEIRNRLQPLLGNVDSMDIILTELAAVQRLARHVAETGEVAHLALVTSGDGMVADLRRALAEVSQDIGQVHRAVVALERATLVTTTGCSFADAIEAATTLAHHRTKLVAGVRWSGDRGGLLSVPRAVAISALAAALGLVADALLETKARTGIDATSLVENNVAVVTLSAGLDPMTLSSVVGQLQLLVDDTTALMVTGHAGAVQLALPMHAVASLPPTVRADTRLT